jgi:multicomponent Na+:H+ antiporter subunit E
VALIITLGTALLGLWLVLSGHYTALLVALGVVSTILVVWVAIRMEIADTEGIPIHLLPGVVGYWIWLTKEMFMANVQVARIVLSPRLPISPTLVHYRASQKTDLGRVIFGNSITLTPGTVTTGIDGDDLRIHALAWVFVDGVEEGEMDARVVALEGGED